MYRDKWVSYCASVYDVELVIFRDKCFSCGSITIDEKCSSKEQFKDVAKGKGMLREPHLVMAGHSTGWDDASALTIDKYIYKMMILINIIISQSL